MQQNLLIVLSLLFIVSMLTMLSKRWKISSPILLVTAGLIISFIPGLPPIRLNSDIVFLVFLPPLLFYAAWNTSWKGFWAERRRIGMLAVGLVIMTSAVIALLSHYLIPNFSLATGFLLGAIISPPDAVAASAILEGQNVSKRVVVILEGESLVNDASSLIVFRFALAAVLTGAFSLVKASQEFLIVTAGGIGIGLLVAVVVYLIHRFLPTTPEIDTAITLLAPYIMYIAAEHFDFSGVMAVVSGGLFLSARSHEVFNYGSRLQTDTVWRIINFILNGFVFILIGLQLNGIMHALKLFTLSQALIYSVLISIVTILVRIIWVWLLSYIRFRLSKKRRGEIFPARSTFLVAWCGMRGVVSLAAALSLPLLLADGSVFRSRNIILFITFSVIFVTLIIQGLSLPLLIRILRIPGDPKSRIEEMEKRLHIRLANAAVDFLNSRSPASPELTERLKRKYENILNFLNNIAEKPGDAESRHTPFSEHHHLLLELVSIRRHELNKLRREGSFDDEMINARERELDLEEATLNSNNL